MGIDLYQEPPAAIAARKQSRMAGSAPGRLTAGRGAKGAGKLPLPAQSGRCAARRVCRAPGNPGPSRGPLGSLFAGRRHDRRRSSRLARYALPQTRDRGANGPARRMRLRRLPALSEMLHRTQRQECGAGGSRDCQPCAGDGQRSARARSGQPSDADRLRRRASCFRCRRQHVFRRAYRAGSDRTAPLDHRPGKEQPRPSPWAFGAARRCRKL